MSRIDQNAYIAAPTGWHRDLIAEYAEYVLRARREIPADLAVAIRLTDSEINPDHTTTWRVKYTVGGAKAQGRRRSFRGLSLS